jgi:hypothetical protein
VLAYVFWHWRDAPVGAEAYEELARRFHASLAARRPPGFLRSACFAIPGASWVPDARAAYEDWYLLEGSAALDEIDRSAVSPPHQDPHDAIARSAFGGAGALYRLRAGAPGDAEPRFASWFPKPERMTYPALFGRLESLTSAGAALWGRQMVLGPSPEFCLRSPEPVELPSPFQAAAAIALRPVWP